MDKAAFAAYGAATELPVPLTEVLTNRADAERIATDVRYPCLVKPAAKTATWLAHTNAKAFTVRSPHELLSVYDAMVVWSGCLLVQEWVEGPETELYSCNAYFGAGGRPLVTFVARKLRQWPPQVGTSASGEECRNDEVRDTTISLFGGLGFQGLAYLEMKRDRRTGRLVIIEPNVGRPTGRSAIAEAGGVELLYTAYCDAAGLPLPQAREQRYAGAAWLDLRRDLQAALVARRQGTLTVAEWLRWLRGPKAHAIWSPHDPKPFVADLGRATLGGARRVLGMSGRSDLQWSEPVGTGRGAP
jgi:predicted ATP-grasp superfamily ATP-dependent carboligase